jgi:RimJ/RimL family protein N-acetyltransferase
MSLPIIQTARIRLQPWSLEDVDALHELWTAPEVRLFLWDDTVIPRETAQMVVQSDLETVQQRNFGCWSLHIPQTSEAVAGFCGFRIIDDGPDIELLYGLRGEYWGQGLATEACRAALGYLWSTCDEVKEVFARTDPPNAKSVEVMKRLGMTHHSTTPSIITYRMQRPS